MLVLLLYLYVLPSYCISIYFKELIYFLLVDIYGYIDGKTTNHLFKDVKLDPAPSYHIC